MEKQDDMQIGTLARVIKAQGGQLILMVILPQGGFIIGQFQDLQKGSPMRDSNPPRPFQFASMEELQQIWSSGGTQPKTKKAAQRRIMAE